MGSSYYPSLHIHGGVCIFLATHIMFNKIDLSKFCIELHFEVTEVELIDFNLIIKSLYRLPKGIMDIFLQSVEKLMQFIITTLVLISTVLQLFMLTNSCKLSLLNCHKNIGYLKSVSESLLADAVN